jgi:ubiquinone/menaquinone biosynthesis C-methylase UbiE
MKPRTARNFDRLAGIYRALERMAFGRDLERARFAWLDRLRDGRSILLLGEGDGRALVRLLALAPEARIHYVDASPAMRARAERRPEVRAAAGRVTFETADAQTCPLPPAAYDAVATLFFLDCFTADHVAALVARVGPALRPGARWLFADFVLPPRGWARLRARLWLRTLYAFFRLTTGLEATALPPSEEILAAAGWEPRESREFQGGLLRSAVYERKEQSPRGRSNRRSGC